MVQISVDTKHDSTSTLRHVIQLLEQELQERGHQPFTPIQVANEPYPQHNNPHTNPNQSLGHTPMQTPPSRFEDASSSTTSSNPFSMFDDASTTQVAKEATQNQNPFSSILDPIEKTSSPKEPTSRVSNQPDYATLAHSPDMFSAFYSGEEKKEPTSDDLLKNLTANELLKESDDDNEEKDSSSTLDFNLEQY
jgi:hypothetical protein